MDTFAKYLLTALICVVALGQFVQVITRYVLEVFVKTERGHTILAIVGEVISLIVGLWLLSWAWDYTQYAWRVWRESPTLYMPTFYSDIALLIGLGLMMAYTASHLVAHIRRLALGAPS